MMRVPDAASVATIRVLEHLLGRKCGGSTGTGTWAAFRLISQMRERGERGSVVTLLCDPGERYLDRYYDDQWLATADLDPPPLLRPPRRLPANRPPGLTAPSPAPGGRLAPEERLADTGLELPPAPDPGRDR